MVKVVNDGEFQKGSRRANIKSLQAHEAYNHVETNTKGNPVRFIQFGSRK